MNSKGILRIKRIKLNLSSFKELDKSYQEGIYSDTPANRKLGRVGMSYKQYAEKNSNKIEEEDNIFKKLSKISLNKIFKNSVREDTKRDLTKFFLQKFNKKEKYQIPLDKRNNLWQNSVSEKIKIENIVPSQDYLNRDIIKNKINNKDKNEIPLGISINYYNPTTKKEEKSNKIILFDGHHRVAANILEGKKEINIKIIPSYNLFKQYKNK